MTPLDCADITDPLKLVREGTSQDRRSSEAPNPAKAPVDPRGVAHDIVFAQAYASLLRYWDESGKADGDWVPFFANDVSAKLAVAAIEDVDAYRTNTQTWFDFLNNLENSGNDAALIERIGYLCAAAATLARQLDILKESLPPNIALKGVLQNLIRSQLGPAFRRLIAYYKGGKDLGVVDAAGAPPDLQILRNPAVTFETVLNAGLSPDWSRDLDWPAYTGKVDPDPSVYGSAGDVFGRLNHCATHNLFKSIFDQFLKAFARVVRAAEQASNAALTDLKAHEPHYALYLAFLRLLQYARASGNTLTKRHLDFYYREILQLKEKGAAPSHVHLLVELAKQVESHELKAGERFKGGKDTQGRDVLFASDQALVANQAKVVALKTVYRHGVEKVNGSVFDEGRIYASPVTDSDDGLGAPLTSADQSWHAFYNKIYASGALREIQMPPADVGFAIASHHLLMAEGLREIRLEIKELIAEKGADEKDGDLGDLKNDVRCLLTTEKGWLEKSALSFARGKNEALVLHVRVTGSDPPITPYDAGVHGYSFQTNSPLLLVKLKHANDQRYAYRALRGINVASLALNVDVQNVKTLAVSNDFGPVDTSKPFQPFGPSPLADSSLIIGSKEVFQKTLRTATLKLKWLTTPVPYPPPSAQSPQIKIDSLADGIWNDTAITAPLYPSAIILSADIKGVLDEPDFDANEHYGTQSRRGFVKLRLMRSFGQDAYQDALIKYLRKDPTATDQATLQVAPPRFVPQDFISTDFGGTPAIAAATDLGPPQPPVGPTVSELSVDYTARTELFLCTGDSEKYDRRSGQFFHLAPFGTAERHAHLAGKGEVVLLPPFAFERDNTPVESEAEFYIGVSALKPPQNLSLLFQVADGTANPLPAKPKAEIHWSYLCRNEWAAFTEDVQDGTGELLNSGIITFPVPREATSDNTLLPSGLIWVRAAVGEASDAVCKLQRVAAQALRATLVGNGTAADFAATSLPAGTIKKLEKPDSAVKSISQPFSSFGGRGAEKDTDFYARISERLRHKDRAVDLWDYERLVLEAFPQIYKVKCLNHTQYESNIYRELAPGHVTIVTVPNLKLRNLRDPLKPFASLGLLDEIAAFLRKRSGCFARLHVRNPRFEEVRVRFNVRLRAGTDLSFAKASLQQAITRFLSPWAFAERGEPTFGGKVYKSVLINFVEDQTCVDYVTDFQLFHDVDSGQLGTSDLDEVEGSSAVSILVSAPAERHDIDLIEQEQDRPLAETCSCDA